MKTTLTALFQGAHRLFWRMDIKGISLDPALYLATTLLVLLHEEASLGSHLFGWSVIALSEVLRHSGLFLGAVSRRQLALHHCNAADRTAVGMYVAFGLWIVSLFVLFTWLLVFFIWHL